MSTTTLFVEILIVGLLALVWLVLLIGSIWHLKCAIEFLKSMSDYAAFFIALIFGSAYIMGIFVDRVSDSLYKRFQYSDNCSNDRSFGEKRLRILNEGEGMAKFLDYQRSRLRIARATIFNLLLIIIAGLIYIVRNNNLPQGGKGILTIIIIIVAGAILTAIVFNTTRRLDRAQYKTLNEAYEIIKEKRGLKSSQPIAAAICYRHKNKSIEFLLVRTKDGKRWTFPKGHVESNPPETPWAAAMREAGEEAGVIGYIKKEPFTCYAYYKGKPGQEDMVAAYLMRVESEDVPEEPEREPHWFSPEEAAKKLAEQRSEQKYIKEYERVISEAQARIK